MEDLIKNIKTEVAYIYPDSNTITLIVFFSEGHISCNILVDGKDVNFEIGLENTLTISRYIKKSAKRHITDNRFVILISPKGMSKKFDFDEGYYIRSNQGMLNGIIKKRKSNLKIENQELEDLLNVAKYALTKVKIKELVTVECRLYLVIESCQLITNILPNQVRNIDEYLFLCNITSEDIQQSNLNEIIVQKIEQVYET